MKKSIEQLIEQFSVAMKDQLEANSEKGDFRDFKDIGSIGLKCENSMEKLEDAIQENNKELIKENIADVANYLMALGNAYELY